MDKPPTQNQNLEESQEITPPDSETKMIAEMEEDNPQKAQQKLQVLVLGSFGISKIANYQLRKNAARELLSKDLDPHQLFKPEYLTKAKDAILLAERPSIFGIKIDRPIVERTKGAIKQVEATQKQHSELLKVYAQEIQRLHGLTDQEISEIITKAQASLKETGLSIEDALRIKAFEVTRYKIEQQVRQESAGMGLSESEIQEMVQKKLQGLDYGKKGEELTTNFQKTSKELVDEGKQKVAKTLGVELKPEPPPKAEIAPLATPVQTRPIPIPPPESIPLKPQVKPFVSFADTLTALKQSISDVFQTKIWQPLTNLTSFIPKINLGGIGGGLNLGGKIGNGLRGLGSLFRIGAPKISGAVAGTAVKGILGAATGGIGAALVGLASTILNNKGIFLVVLILPFVIIYMLLTGPHIFSSYTSQNPLQLSLSNKKIYSWRKFEEQSLTLNLKWTQFEKNNLTTSKEYLSLDPNRHDDVKK